MVDPTGCAVAVDFSKSSRRCAVCPVAHSLGQHHEHKLCYWCMPCLLSVCAGVPGGVPDRQSTYCSVAKLSMCHSSGARQQAF
jgi:hypothetical protein